MNNYFLKLLLPSILFVIVVIITLSYQVFQQAETTTNKQPITPSYQQLFLEAVDCAALMAATESITKGELSPGSNVFNLIGYTLGMAQDYALQANMDISQAKKLYDKKTIAYYFQLEKAAPADLEKKRIIAERCIATARHYDPATMIDAALEDAKQE